MEHFEEKIDSELKYDGIIVNVTVDHAKLENGAVVKREVVNHPGGVGIIAMDDEGFCYMVKQFRYPAQKVLLEIPAGKLEYGEEPFSCAYRELSEETGFQADSFDYLGSFYTSPGFSNELLHIYFAHNLKEGISHPDENEFLNVEKFHIDSLYEMAVSGKIIDAKTVIGILKVYIIYHTH